MKKYIIILVSLLSFSAVNAQEKQESKIKESSFEVAGVCNMCKNRIEDAAMRTKGVKTATWNKESKQLDVVFNSDKTDLEQIKKAVATKGHDAEGMPSDSTAYSKLPKCCAYRDSDLKTH